MSDEKHTPGPWSVKNDYDERHIVIANIDGESFPDGTTSYTYDFVCDTYGGDYESESRAVANANARLISAAPELLAVVREACAIFDANYETEDEYNSDLASDLWKDEIHRKLTEAIAKAEGRK